MEIGFDELQMNNPDNKYNLPENLIYINDIDHGAFAKVIHVKEKGTKKEFALKIVNKSESNIDLINRMKEEIIILKQLEHENIVKYYGQFENLNQLFIKMEYLKYGTLEKWMQTHKNISEEEASLIIKKVLSAIAYLHQNQICHRDLKPQNIMFARENDLSSIKIIDFGLSLQNVDSLFNSDYWGTLIYMAPEEIERKSYYLSVDNWSIGILMYMLLNNGEHPFYHENDNRKTFLKNLKENKPLVFKNKISYMAMHLIKKLLEYDPIKRYKASDALKHPWITRNPEDKIPQTFNEQLNTFSIINNAKNLMMISIFLNYFKKNNIYQKYKLRTKSKDFSRRKSKSTIYKIDDEYIKKCEFFNRTKRDKLRELRGKNLFVKKDTDKSEEKNNNNSIANTNSTSHNNMSNSNSSNSNNYIKRHYETTNHTNNIKSKKYFHLSKKKKDTPLLLIDSNNLSHNKIKRKNFFSEKKKNNIIYNYDKKGKQINLETEYINKNFLSESKNRKIFLTATQTKPFNDFNNNNKMDLNTFNFINENINNIKPINLFLKNKNLIKLKSKKLKSRTDIAHVQLEQIINENDRIKKPKNHVHNLKLPNISYNNIHTTRKSKKNIKFLYN